MEVISDLHKIGCFLTQTFQKVFFSRQYNSQIFLSEDKLVFKRAVSKVISLEAHIIAMK